MNSLLSFPSRGPWGNASYRGNCSGHIIKELLAHFFPKQPPHQFVEVFSGGGTGQDVAKELGLKNSIHLDLLNGWNALQDELPVGSDFTFSHPPYWDIIAYESQRKTHDVDDLSNSMSYSDFIKKLDKVNEKIYHNLLSGGRHAFLVGDIRKKGVYYSIIKDMTFFGNLEAHLIKEQFQTTSGRKTYSNSSFIPIAHEHLLIFHKKETWLVPIKFTKDFVRDIREMEGATWKDLVRAAIQSQQNATAESVYELLKDSKKAQTNNHVREKIRQVLNQFNEFAKVGDYWKIAS